MRSSFLVPRKKLTRKRLACYITASLIAFLFVLFIVLGVAVSPFFFVPIAIFLVLFLLAGWIYWFWIRLIAQPFEISTKDLALKYRILTVLAAIASVGLGLSTFGIAGAFLGPKVSPFVVAMYSYSHFVFFVTQWLALTELVTLCWLIISCASKKKIRRPHKNLYWVRGRVIFTLVAAFFTTIAAMVTATNPPTFTTVELPLTRFPASLDGYRLSVATDVHIGQTIGKKEIDVTVPNLNAIGAEAILLIGDFSDAGPDDVGEAFEEFGNLKARDGVYFVTGNHEYIGGHAEEWIDFFNKSFGIKTLENERVSLPPGANDSNSFDLAGVNDWSADPNITKAVENRNSTKELIVMAHQPVQIEGSHEVGAGLQISGHVHGGQVPPFHLISWLTNPYFAGLSHHKDSTWIYVSQGTRCWGPQIRLFSWNEITIFKLRNADLFKKDHGNLEPIISYSDSPSEN